MDGFDLDAHFVVNGVDFDLANRRENACAATGLPGDSQRPRHPSAWRHQVA